jgi:hypothetical protein
LAAPGRNVTARRIAAMTHVLIALAAALGLAQSAHAQVPTADSIRQLLTRATYLFQGVVTKWGATAAPALKPSSQTGVVRVSATLACPHEVGDFTGEDVTVLASRATHVPVGAPTWFFATGWSIGTTVSVTLTATVPAPGAPRSDSLTANFHRAVFLGKRAAAQAAAHVANEIMLATVNSVAHAASRGHEQESEHAVRWAALGVTFDSLWGIARWDTVSKGHTTPVYGWTPPPASPRRTEVLVPEAVAFAEMGTPRLAPDTQRIFLLELISRRPNLRVLDRHATAFVPDASSVLLPADARLLGAALPDPAFTLAPVNQCELPIP